MLKTILLIGTFVTAAWSVNFYSLSVPGTNYELLRMNRYEGRKVLLVNIATGSNQVAQLGELQQLYSQHQDSLVIIVFPSNSFGNELRSNADIRGFLQANYNAGYLVAAKSPVLGDSANLIYRWLGQKQQNDVADYVPGTDFQKALIDSHGKLIGMYDSSITPLSSTIQNAIHNSY